MEDGKLSLGLEVWSEVQSGLQEMKSVGWDCSQSDYFFEVIPQASAISSHMHLYRAVLVPPELVLRQRGCWTLTDFVAVSLTAAI